MKRAEDGYCSGGQGTIELIGYRKGWRASDDLYIFQVLIKRILRDELSGNRFECMFFSALEWVIH